MAFIDTGMPPGAEGNPTARQIRRQDLFVEIIMVADRFDGDAAPSSRQDILGNEFLYLQKPFHPMEIRQLSRTLADNWRMERRLRGDQQVLGLRIGERTRELEPLTAQLQGDIAQRQSVEQALRVSEEKCGKRWCRRR